MRLTVLGASPSPPNPGGACSGYLVEDRPTSVLLDCGAGVAGRLRQWADLERLEAVVISHFHADHFLDLVALRYGLKYGRWRKNKRLPVLVPPSGTEFLARLGEALGNDPSFFSAVFQLQEYQSRTAFYLGSLELRAHLVQHAVPCFAFAVTGDGRRLAYSADSAPCAALEEAARGADLFLCEASLASPDADEGGRAARSHLSATESGQVASRARVGKLLLTHLPIEDAPNRLRKARAAFVGPVTLAAEGTSYEV